ncbi:hypothetical protein COW46_03670 [Candidatus Gracilibacteria bacterium CG17_big_fil_post_rev_8_21_14_2_50_48_13]|nr:MAG: hypothetical protein COW46_03670 [Candidatus Gracilibacteria bacterium CG17_big_fil_post_rev_8_21_14_2_50_48_13]
MEAPKQPIVETEIMRIARESRPWRLLVLRGVARFLDGIFLMVPMGLFVSGVLSMAPQGKQSSFTLWLGLACMLVIMLYHPVCEVRFGGSLAKQLLGLQVLTAEGEYISSMQAAKRWLTTLFGSLGQVGDIVAAVAIITNEYHQRVGDYWANTYVIEKSAREKLHEGALHL